MITLEQDKVFRAYEQMFHTEGWRLLVEDLIDRQDMLKEQVLNFSTTDHSLARAQGRQFVYNWLLALEGELKQAEQWLREHPDE